MCGTNSGAAAQDYLLPKTGYFGPRKVSCAAPLGLMHADGAISRCGVGLTQTCRMTNGWTAVLQNNVNLPEGLQWSDIGSVFFRCDCQNGASQALTPTCNSSSCGQ